jgi:hypothetical protein
MINGNFISGKSTSPATLEKSNFYLPGFKQTITFFPK